MTQPDDTTSENDLRAREQRVRAERAKRDKAHQDQDRIRSLDFQELLIALEDSHGRRGRDFEIVDAGRFGFIAVARGEAVQWKTYRSKILRDKYVPSTEEVLGFVRPHVIHPPVAQFDDAVSGAPAVLDVLANALVELYGVKERDDRGK